MTATPNPADLLKYAAAILWQHIEWTTDTIAGTGCDADHDNELNALTAAACEVADLADQLENTRTYSDGRAVQTTREIEPGVYTVHVWHPDPATEQPRSWRGNLRHDPDVECPGVYEVTTDPARQRINVQVVRT